MVLKKEIEMLLYFYLKKRSSFLIPHISLLTGAAKSSKHHFTRWKFEIFLIFYRTLVKK